MTKPLSTVFMGTPDFAVPTLRALLESGHEVRAVYTQPPRPAGRGQKDTPSPVHQFALKAGLNVLTPTSLKSPEAQAEFAALKADIAVVAAYGLLLPPPILEAFPLGCINLHPSLLPRWRGAAPIQRSIMAGDAETGVVIMQMNEGLDTGDMLLVNRVAVPPHATAGDMHDELSAIGAHMVLATLEGLQNKTLKPTRQPLDGVTYANKITKEECQIDWTQTARQIDCRIRGLNPAPGAFTLLDGEKLKILMAQPVSISHNAPPGTVIDDLLTIACGSGAIRPNIVQRAGKRAMPADEMLRGTPIPAGTVLV